MGKIVWSDALSLGNETIDSEHKRLIKIANAIIRLAREDMGKKKIINAMQYLREYTVFHFQNEEKFMSQIQYPLSDAHSAEHAELKHQVKSYQYALFHSVVITGDELLDFMKKWLIDHILNSDLKIKEFQIEQARLSQMKKNKSSEPLK